MKLQALSLLLALAITSTAHAETKNLDEIMAKARPDETKDLGKLLQQFRIVPAKHPKTNESLFKVVWVEAGSVFDREGLKAGDLVTSNNAAPPSKKMGLSTHQNNK